MGIAASVLSRRRDRRSVSALVLSENEALAIALAWRRKLQGFVRLDTAAATDGLTSADPSGFSVVQSYEWVSFVFDRRSPFDCKDLKGAAAAARASTLVWFALSCCAGFGGDENPQFWLKVFSALTRIPYCPYQPLVSDAIGFFDQPGKVFPRVRVFPKKGYESKMLRIFASQSTENDPIEEILLKLKPYIIPHRWTRSIPVAVDHVSVERLASILPTIQLDTTTSKLPQLRPLLLCINDEDLGADVAIQGILARTEARILVHTYHHSTSNPFRAYRMVNSLVANQTRTNSRVHIESLDLSGVMGSESKCQMVCSALPISHAVSTLQLSSGPHAHADFHDLNVAWLGYAIFHPDSVEHSTFMNLSVDIRRLPVEQLKILSRMAVGNNLLSTGSTASRAYYEGAVRGGTTVHLHEHNKSEVIHTFATDSRVILCVTSTNASQWGPWVRAVVSGVGLGWIRRDCIRRVEARSPGPSCVRRLRLDVGPAGLDDHTEVLLFRWLKLLGARLTYLDVVSHMCLSAETVQSILRACPNLTSLRIHHDGSCWSDDEMMVLTPEIPRLQALEVRVDSSEVIKPFKARQLDDLEILRVLSPVPNGFPASRDSMLTILEKYPRLKYFGWEGVHPRQKWDNATYDERCERTKELLGEITPGVHNTALVPMRLDSRLAFLSVVRQSTKTCPSVVSQISPDIAKLIFKFSSSSSPRLIHIRDD